MPQSEVKQAGGWNKEVWNIIYAQVPTGDALAQRAGCPNRLAYAVFHLLLIAAQIQEFKPLVQRSFSMAEDMLAQMQEVNYACMSH